MKLSEAIRAGSKLKPKGVKTLFSTDESGTTRTCAIGAAIDVTIGQVMFMYLEHGEAIKSLNATFPMLRAICPCGEFLQYGYYTYKKGHQLNNHIATLNDILKLTREEIADWVAVFEDWDEALELNSAMNETIDAINTGLASHVGSTDTVLAEIETRKELSLV